VFYLLLDESSEKNQLLPTVQQLKDLFGVLEFKLGALDFLNSLEGWDMLLKSVEVGLQDRFLDLKGDSQDRFCNPEFDVDDGSSSNESTQISAEPNLSSPVLSQAMQDLDNSISTVPIAQGYQMNDHHPFIRSICPSAQNISKLLQALAEIGRLGEATSAILQVSPEVAAWCIAFVKWCLGAPPSVRQLNKDGTKTTVMLLQQPNSNIVLEIAELGSEDFYVRAFKNIGQIENLLWESQSTQHSGRFWIGLVSPKIYFQARLQDLQQRYDLLHVVNTLLVLAREVPKHTKHFPSSNDIVDLVALLFDIDKVATRLEKLDTSEFLDYWSRNNEARAIYITHMFVEILILSLVENFRHNSGEDILIGTPENRQNFNHHPFITPIIRWLQRKPGDEELHLPVLLPQRICRDLLALIGVDQSCIDGNAPLISSRRGQVAYPSCLETLSLNARCPLSYRVHQGRLQYEGQYYAYATGDNGTDLAGILYKTPGRSITSRLPLAFQPTTQERSASTEENQQWFCSKQDSYLALYFKPYIHSHYTLDPRSFINACETTILQNCQPECFSLTTTPDDEIRYCADIASVFSCKSMRPLRVLSCQNHVDTLFIQTVWTELWGETNSINELERQKAILVAKGECCQNCACRSALQILKSKFSGPELEQARAVVII
jgi:hypothetical protein